MVCDNPKCLRKLSNVAAPDPSQSSSKSIKEGSRTVAASMVLPRKRRQCPYGSRCKVCHETATQNGAKFCHGCAYKRGICSICGRAIMDITGRSMSNK